MSFIFALWLAGWRVVLANLLWPLGFLLWGVLLCLIVRRAKRREEAVQQEQPVAQEQEPVEFTEEELQRLAELRRRYVAQEVQP